MIVEGDPLPIPDNVILTRSKAQKMGETYSHIPASAKIIKLFLRELIVGQYSASDALKDVAAVENNGADEWEDLEPDTEVTPLEGTIPYEQLMKYVNKGDIEDLDGADLYDMDNMQGTSPQNRRWAGSDNATQVMIAGFIKNVVESNAGGFKENVYPHFNDEEKEFLENLLK